VPPLSRVLGLIGNQKKRRTVQLHARILNLSSLSGPVRLKDTFLTIPKEVENSRIKRNDEIKKKGFENPRENALGRKQDEAKL